MTKEELLKKETFITLFSIDNELDRTEKENEFIQIARDLKCMREFNNLLKVWKKEMSKKVVMDNEITAPNIPISGLDGGSFNCNEKGIMKKGEIICSHLLIPTYIYRNKKTGEEKVQLSFYKKRKWFNCIVDKYTISSAYKIVSLSRRGIEITSENARGIVTYLSEVININADLIPYGDSVSELGWDDDDFIPYNGVSVLDSVDDFKLVFESVKCNGNFDDWYKLVKKLRENKYIQIIMAVTFASPLLEKISVMPYIVNLWSSMSGSGKTVACMVAMSSWGYPANGGLHFSTNNTKNFYIKMAGFLKNITLFCDELQVIKHSKELKLDNLVMELSNGKERGRLSENSEIKQAKIWYNNFLFTNNDKLAKENSGEQTYNRIIDIECNEILIKNGKQVVEVIKKNYGFAGKKYINYIVDIGFEKISKKVDEYAKQLCDNYFATEKQALCIATILVANKLSQECIFQGERQLTIDDVKDFVNDRDEILTWKKAYQYIIDDFAENKKCFEEDSNGKFWGRTIIGSDSEVYGYVVLKKNLVEELEKGNFEFDSIKKDWYKVEIIQKNTQGKLCQHTSVYGQKGTYVTLFIKEEYLSNQ